MNFNDIFLIKSIDIPYKDQLISDITQYVKNNQNLTPEKWRCQVSSSFDLHHRHNFNFGNLKNVISNIFKEYTKTLNLQKFGDFEVGNFWWNFYVGSNFQEKHDHLDDDFSGIIYLKLDRKVHLPTIFYNPIYNKRFHHIAEIPNISCIPDVRENDVIIFPSGIPHEVLPHNTQIPRITLSFNINYYDLKPNFINYS